ncbi:MAG TPA: CBS domain-containing protein [Streptosporangiaceae bacterium]|jgi:CBS domain-containing protein
MNATVGDVMTARVIAVKRSANYKEICCVLRQYRVSACPVINDEGRVVGVVSEADLLYKVADPSPPSGLIRLLEMALDLLVRVRHTEGVVAIHDRLMVAETSGHLLGA